VWARPRRIGWQQARAAPPPVGEFDAAGRDGRGRCTRHRGTAGSLVSATVPSSVLEEGPRNEEFGFSPRRRLAGDAREGGGLDPAPTLGRGTSAAVVLDPPAALEPAAVTTGTPDRREAGGLGLSEKVWREERSPFKSPARSETVAIVGIPVGRVFPGEESALEDKALAGGGRVNPPRGGGTGMGLGGGGGGACRLGGARRGLNGEEDGDGGGRGGGGGVGAGVDTRRRDESLGGARGRDGSALLSRSS